MIALVTGLSGFVGTHLAALLRAQGQEPVPLALQGSRVDLRDPAAVDRAVADIKPDRVYHLAGISSVARSWQEPDLIYEVNVQGTRNLLRAVRAHAPKARVLLVSSGFVYGEAEADQSEFSEHDLPSPPNPYATSKLLIEMEGDFYFRVFGQDVRRVRPMGHTGPGHRLGFVVPDLASQVAAMALGQAPLELKVGSLDVVREFGDVRDVVRAYVSIMEQGEPGGLYNVAANEPHTIREVARTLLDTAGVKAELSQTSARMRPQDTSTPRLDTSRVAALGFRFQIPFAQTMADVLEEWMEKVRAGQRPAKK